METAKREQTAVNDSGTGSGSDTPLTQRRSPPVHLPFALSRRFSSRSTASRMSHVQPDEIRIIPCGACGGDGGGYEGGNERWIRCVACNGQGELETELEPVSLEEMEDAVWCD